MAKARGRTRRSTLDRRPRPAPVTAALRSCSGCVERYEPPVRCDAVHPGLRLLPGQLAGVLRVEIAVQEEHERPIFVLVDQRSPMFFGSQNCFKSVYAARLATVVAWIANQNNDRIGALLFGDEQQRDIRARRSKHAVLELLHQLVEFNQRLRSPIAATMTPLHEMLTETSRVARPGSLVILLSDFHDFTASCAEPLSQLAKRSDVMAIHLYDSLERQLPPARQLAISDGSRRLTLDVASVAETFLKTFDERQQRLRQSCVTSGVQYVHAPVHQDLAGFVRDLFTSRKSRREAVAP